MRKAGKTVSDPDLRPEYDFSALQGGVRGKYFERYLAGVDVVLLEWEPRKARANLAKHGVDFHEAGTVWDDPLATTFPDPEHSIEEPRLTTIGASVSGRILVVAHTDRGRAIRVISARRATPRERKFYAESR